MSRSDVMRFIFSHEARLSNELVYAHENFKRDPCPLNAFELSLALQRVEDFSEFSKELAFFVNS